jgi:hypothetical protein
MKYRDVLYQLLLEQQTRDFGQQKRLMKTPDELAEDVS